MRTERRRSLIIINREWRFIRGDEAGYEDKGPERPDYDDSRWQHVGLPHSFSIPYFMENEWFIGFGWYRKLLDYRMEWKGKLVHLEFEGVFQVAEVYVNGSLAGRHEGGYTGFSYDITDWLRPGANVIAVRVNNEWNGRIAPRSGEHTFSGGIYRDVYLTVTEPLHTAWNGTFATTPLLSDDEGAVRMQVRMQTEAVNRTDADKLVTVRTVIRDREGRTAAAMEQTLDVPARATRKFDCLSGPVTNPRLWCPEDPYLYRVTTEIVTEEGVADEIEDTMGFRWMEWTADEGFFLNGKHVYLNGANVHQDQAGWGDAVTQAAIYRDVKMIKDAGMNFIRGSHYPHHPAFARACDEYGVLFWSEATFWGMGGGGNDGGERTDWRASAYPVLQEDRPAFEDSAIRQLREMIRINRNRPSLIVWSMCNEPFFSHESVREQAIGLLRRMVAVSREEDPTRPAAAGGGQRWNLDRPEIADVAGLNGDGGAFYMKWEGDERIDDPQSERPRVPQVVSEYGSEVMDRPGRYRPYYDHVAASLTDPYRHAAPKWRSGQALWCGFHHGSLANDMGHMGIIDYYRLPLRGWYWYRFNYFASQAEAVGDSLGYLGIEPPASEGSEPEWPRQGNPSQIRLYPGIGSSSSIRNDGTDDTQLIVELADENGKRVDASIPVTLTIVSGPGQFPSHDPKRIGTDTGLAVIEGLGAIAFRSYYAGETLISATAPGLSGALLTIVTIGESAGEEPDMSIPRPAVTAKTVRSSDDGTSLLDLATNRPSRASSEARGHGKNNANDADGGTSWRAGGEGPGEWWMLDLEGDKYPSRIELVFEQAGKYRFIVEGTSDGETWSTLLDRRERAGERQTVAEPLGETACRYVRITFAETPSGVPANLRTFGLLGFNQA